MVLHAYMCTTQIYTYMLPQEKFTFVFVTLSNKVLSGTI